MAVIEGRTWLEILQPAQCWQLLAGEELGRVAVLVDGVPEIYPVNHIVDAETIVFRTDRGSKLHGMARSPLVCFEVDGTDHVERRGWSVMVKGRAVEVAGGDAIARLAGLDLRYWAPGEKQHWIRIEPEQVTGRRIYRPEADG